MTLTPEQKAAGWIEWNGSDVCPIKDSATRLQVIVGASGHFTPTEAAYPCKSWTWRDITAYRIIKAHGADAAPARPTPFPASYDELVWDDAGWSQTIIVDGKRPEWLRDDDRITRYLEGEGYAATDRYCRDTQSIRVRRREPKRETVYGALLSLLNGVDLTVSFYLIDGKPDLSTLKIAEDAL